MMIFAVFSGFIAAMLAPGIQKLSPKFGGWLMASIPFAIFLYLHTLIGPIDAGEVLLYSYAWFPAAGISLSFMVDGLSLTFMLIISGVGTLILFYSNGYFRGHPKQGRIYSYLLFFMASMMGVVASDNLITLFVFWELTSISSYLLIGFNHESEKARKAALQALLVTGGGGLAMLAGLIILGSVGGSYQINTLLNQTQIVQESPLFIVMMALLLLGAFTPKLHS